VSYFRPRKTRETGPRSICSLPDSTQKLSRKRGGVTASRIQLRSCLEKGVGSTQQSVPISTVSFQGCSPVLGPSWGGVGPSCPPQEPGTGGGAFQPALANFIFYFFWKPAVTNRSVPAPQWHSALTSTGTQDSETVCAPPNPFLGPNLRRGERKFLLQGIFLRQLRLYPVNGATK
jgi:hypothetical protein